MTRISGAREFETSDPLALPEAATVLGPNHNPMSHRESAIVMNMAIDQAGLTILEQTHVVDGLRTMTREGGNYGEITVPQANLFSLYKIYAPELTGTKLIGYRNSVAQAFGRSACIGEYFSICTNVSLFGNDILFNRKNTTNANAGQMIDWVVDRVAPMLQSVEEQIQRLRDLQLTNVQREAAMFRMFERKVLPNKYIQPLGEVARSEDGEAYPEVVEAGGSALALMHASTRVIQAETSLRRQAELSQNIGSYFRFGKAMAA